MVSTLTINHFEDFLKVVSGLSGHWRVEPWWRGESTQKDEIGDCKLMPSVFRNDPSPIYEHNLAQRFRRSAPTRYPNCPPHHNLAAWLFLMQHYGLPTRLLDWTESPLTALFFSVSNPQYTDVPATLWLLSPTNLNRHTLTDTHIFLPHDSPVFALCAEAFQGSRTLPAQQVVALYPTEFDLRITVQQSAFTLHASPIALDQIDGAKQFLQRYTIPPEAKTEILLFLHALGVRRSLLFPDLPNLATHLAQQKYHDEPPISPPPSSPPAS